MPARRLVQKTHLRHLAPLLVVALTLIAWGAVPWGTFQFDDFPNVVRDPATTDPAALAGRLLHGLRPLTRISYFLDAKLFGLHPAGFLATNLLLHLATVLLVHALALRRLGEVGAFAAALFFALQPAHAEVVAYVSGRSTGLMTPLLLGGLLLHDRGRLVGALALFVMACLAKEVALVFPALLLIWEATRPVPRPGAVRGVLGGAIAAVVVGASLLCLEFYRSLAASCFALRPVLDNILANGRAVPMMLLLWVRPWALSADHDLAVSGHIGGSLAGLFFLGAVVGAALALRRRFPVLALALLWPLIALLPTNSIIPKIDLVTEKPLYLAWVGPSLALGAGVSVLWTAARTTYARRLLAAGVAVLLGIHAGASMWRVALWRDPTRLWLDATAKAPGKSRCWNNLGMAHLSAGRDAEAVAALERAVRLDPANELAWANLETARILCGPACAPY